MGKTIILNKAEERTNQIMVFIFFGEQYQEQFLICAETIPSHWNVLVITDKKFICSKAKIIQVPTPATVYDMLTFRKNIPDFVDLKRYSQIWYSDPDMLFTGDIMKQYEYNRIVRVSFEPGCDIYHPCMRGGFSEEELMKLKNENAPCINGGLFAVPYNKYNFFGRYRLLMNFFSSRWPNDKSTDQHVLNNMYHRKLADMSLFKEEEVRFHPQEKGQSFGLVNHYIGMGMHKTEIMNNELNRIKNA